MSGLINLISEYSSRLAILPILALMNVIITIIIHYINSKKILKYLPSLIIGVAALIIGFYSISIFNTPMGLNTSWIAIFLGATSLVGICVGFIIDLMTSIKLNMKFNGNNKDDILENSSNGKNYFRARRKNKRKKND